MALTERVPLAINEAGDLYLEGRRVFLEDLVELYREGRSPEEIAAAYPGLALADVHAVLAWTLRHPEEVEAYLERQRARFRLLPQAGARGEEPILTPVARPRGSVIELLVADRE